MSISAALRASLLCLAITACAPVQSSRVPQTETVASRNLLPGTAVPEATQPEPTHTPSPTPANTPDLNGEIITIFHLCGASGPLGAGNASRILAVEHAVEAINAAGGIFGAELDLRFVDAKGNADDALAGLARLLRQHGEPPLILICDPATEAALAAQLDEDDLVALAPGANAQPGGPLFGIDATAQQQATFAIETLAESWDTLKPEDAGDELRLAVITWPAELAGNVDFESLLAAEEPPANLVLEAELETEPDVNAFDFVYAARDANANIIFINARGFGLAALLNALNELGLSQRFVVIAPAAAYDAGTIAHLADPAYASGLYLTSAWAWWDEGGDVIDTAEALGPGAEFRDWGYLQMVGAVDVARRALEDAILEDSYEDLSPGTVREALEALRDYPAFGGVFTVDYRNRVRSLEGLRLWQVGDEPNALILVE